MPLQQRSGPTWVVWIAVGLYCAFSAALLWPLPLHLRTALPGDPAGDLGVYVWNLWIFRHEFLDHGHLPLSTAHVFAYTGGADFSLHNYTPLAGLAGMAFMGVLGVVGTFNVVLIGFVAASGFAVYLLARRLELGQIAAFAAGAVFIASPVITARETAHFSLVTTAALPLFLLAVMHVLDSGRTRDAVLVGVLAAVASYSDAYFGIYCALIGLFEVAWRFVRVTLVPGGGQSPGRQRAIRSCDGLGLLMLVPILLHAVLGIRQLQLGPVWVGLEPLHTPVLVIVVCLATRTWLRWSPEFSISDPDHRLPRLVRLGWLSVGVCLVLLLPPLLGIAERIVQGRLPETAILWRSSPRGVDLLSYAVPNPLHPWFGRWTSGWFMPDRQDAFPEFVGSFSLVAIVFIGLTALARPLPAFWLRFTGAFMLLSLGPFVHLAGFSTLIPGPWAILRYVPVIGMARAPSRFAIVAVLGLSILLGYAVEAWLRKPGRFGKAVLLLVLVAVALELNPVPRHMYPADVPSVYSLIASGDESAAVLELPTGVRDGTSSVGDFSALSQYFQTAHGHPLVGGYLSRVSRWRKDESRRSPVLRLLMTLSEPGEAPTSDDLERARTSRDPFLRRTCVGYVVVNKHRATPRLREVAVDVLRLVPVHEDEQFELWRPVDPPECDPGPRRRGGKPVVLPAARFH